MAYRMAYGPDGEAEVVEESHFSSVLRAEGWTLHPQDPAAPQSTPTDPADESAPDPIEEP